MGQRHQVFLIARVQPHGESIPRYRCIAGYRHHWSSGSRPLHAARRCIAMIKQPENAEILREEIRAMRGKYGRYGCDPKLPPMPCPFAWHLLSVSWDMDFVLAPHKSPSYAGCTQRGWIFQAGFDCWDFDHEDGMTVIDVTNPDKPTYCFLLHNTLPLTGAEYLRRRGEEFTCNQIESDELDPPGPDDGFEEAERLIPFDALAEAWPRSYVHRWGGLKGSFDDLAADGEAALAQEDVRSEEVAQCALPSLVAVALRGAVTQGLRAGDTSSIEDTLWLPGRAEMVREIVYEQIGHQDTSTAVPLLRKLAEQEIERAHGTLNLSCVQILDNQLLRATKNLHGLISLNLSHNRRLKTYTIEQLLMGLPCLKRLVLINCPCIPSTELDMLLRSKPRLFYNLEALIHPLLAPAKRAIWHPAITFLSVDPNRSWSDCDGISLPFISPAAIVRGLTDVFTPISCADCGGDAKCFASGALSVGLASSASARPCEQSWYERSISFAPILNPNYKSPRRGDWVFMLVLPTSHPHSHVIGWAFIRLLPSTETLAMPATESNSSACRQRRSSHSRDKSKLDFEVYNLRGFLDFQIREGRPPVSEDAIQSVERLMQQVSDSYRIGFGRNAEAVKLPLMTREVASYCLCRVFRSYNVEGQDTQNNLSDAPSGISLTANGVDIAPAFSTAYDASPTLLSVS